MKIIVNIQGKQTELTPEEAKELYRELCRIFAHPLPYAGPISFPPMMMEPHTPPMFTPPWPSPTREPFMGDIAENH